MSSHNYKNNGNHSKYGFSNILESLNNIDNCIDQTPKKLNYTLSLGINSNYLINNDKENSFFKANEDKKHVMNHNEYFSNNSHFHNYYGHDNQCGMPPYYPCNNPPQPDHYNYSQYPNYGNYYHQQPYFSFDYANNHYYPENFDPQYYNNHPQDAYYYNQLTPVSGHKIKENSGVNRSESKNKLVEKEDKKENFQVKNILQQVVISEFQPNYDIYEEVNSNNKQNQDKYFQTPYGRYKQNLNQSKSKKSYMKQETQHQQYQTKKITPKAISKRKIYSNNKYTPTTQNERIQDIEENFNSKTNTAFQSQQLIDTSNTFYENLCSNQNSQKFNFVNNKQSNIQFKNSIQENKLLKKANDINKNNISSLSFSKMQDEKNNCSNINYLEKNRKESIEVQNQQVEDESEIDQEDQNCLESLKDGSIHQEYSSKCDSLEQSSQEAKPCNCRNSKCLKRYCDCFAAGLYCQAECKCEKCHNQLDYEEERQKAIQKRKSVQKMLFNQQFKIIHTLKVVIVKILTV